MLLCAINLSDLPAGDVFIGIHGVTDALYIHEACSAPLELDRCKLEFSVTLSWLGGEWKRMKASKSTDAQKAFILRQGEGGMPVAEICRKAGISQATYFNWKKRYGGLLPDEMRRLKLLEDENSRLKKNVADLTLDREMASV